MPCRTCPTRRQSSTRCPQRTNISNPSWPKANSTPNPSSSTSRTTATARACTGWRPSASPGSRPRPSGLSVSSSPSSAGLQNCRHRSPSCRKNWVSASRSWLPRPRPAASGRPGLESRSRKLVKSPSSARINSKRSGKLSPLKLSRTSRPRSQSRPSLKNANTANERLQKSRN